MIVATMYLNTISGILFGSLFVLFINLLLNLLVFDRLKSATSEDVQRKLGTCPMVFITKLDPVALPEKGRYVEGPLLCAVGDSAFFAKILLPGV